MTTRRVDLAVGLVVAVLALAGASWQVDAATPEPGEGQKTLPRLVCPLH
jgi:hypothetical protein